MANFDKPAFTWMEDPSVDLTTQAVDVMSPPALNPPISITLAYSNGTGEGGGGGANPITGYGYGLSG